ncbi:NAD(P)/FAD-dependent oxidoreductase [Intrasporangium sp. YIM S08009]|uniref:NAD(P)/FAD-dependent oxidoreductase n=1 Tax=Intrasporangium zincisolvens TaxID=3080018 RepID=UPI002B05E429|nr:FAD-dependent oxidoreductase [Intrasporangium sp. YIM S08009]
MARFATGVVIVGGSAAGLSAADGLREGGYTGSITIVDENLEPGFDRPMLSKGLLASSDAAPAPLRTPQRLEDQAVTVLPGHRAMGLDIDRRLVVTSYGEAIPYEQVVIASGVDARRMVTTSGDALPALRTLADLETVRAMVADGGPLTIVGGGYIGLEAAAALRPCGSEVTVLCPSDLPLVGVLGPLVAGWLRDRHLEAGVRLELGARVRTVEDTPGGYRLTLADGRVTTAHHVLAGVGTEPNTEWLIGSGVALDDGILTDAAGRTNVPGVWAAGDVAASLRPDTSEHRRVEHWTRAIEHGRRVGLNIARGEAVAPDAVPYVWTEQPGTTLHLFGERHADDEDLLVRGSLASGEFVVLHGRDGELHAVTLSGFPAEARTYKRLLRSRATLADALDVART